MPKTIRYILLLCAIATVAHSQNLEIHRTSLELDIGTAIELALSYNLALRSRHIDTEIAKRNFDHRFNVFMPQISSQGTLARPNTAPENPLAGLYDDLLEQIDPTWDLGDFDPDEELQVEDPPRWNLSTSVGVQFSLAAQMFHSLDAVKLAYNNAQVDLHEAKRELEKQVRSAFYQLLLQQEQLQLAQRRLEAGEERLQEMERNYNSGLIDELTLLRTQVAIQNQRPAILRMEQAIKTAKLSMASMLGLAFDEEFHLSGAISDELPRLAEQQTLMLLLDRNKDIQAAIRGIQGLETQIKMTRAEMFPTLTLAFSLSPMLSGDPFSSDLWDDELWSDRGSFSITLRQQLHPLLPGSQTRQQLANQKNQLQLAQLRVEQAYNAISLQLQRLYGELRAAYETIDSLQANAALAQRAYDLAIEAYNSGLRDYSVVRDGEMELADARLQLLQEQHRVLELLLELEYLLSTPMEKLKETHQ